MRSASNEKLFHPMPSASITKQNPFSTACSDESSTWTRTATSRTITEGHTDASWNLPRKPSTAGCPGLASAIQTLPDMMDSTASSSSPAVQMPYSSAVALNALAPASASSCRPFFWTQKRSAHLSLMPSGLVSRRNFSTPSGMDSVRWGNCGTASGAAVADDAAAMAREAASLGARASERGGAPGRNAASRARVCARGCR